MHTQAKIDAKIAEAQASLAAKEVAKKEEQASRLSEADRATALEAEKAQKGEAEKRRRRGRLRSSLMRRRHQTPSNPCRIRAN